MEIHGFPCKSMHFRGNPWISIEIHGNPWKSMRAPAHASAETPGGELELESDSSGYIDLEGREVDEELAEMFGELGLDLCFIMTVVLRLLPRTRN